MKGLELAEAYFAAHGLPLFSRDFPALRERAAAGLIGLGSECLGFDDELSRDHDWGPGFCVWLTPPDHQEFGVRLAEAYRSLPELYHGFARKKSEWGDGRVGVFQTDAFFGRLLGCSRMPETPHDWLRLQENSLSTATAGRIFHDPLGEFTRMRRHLLDFYPEDVRLLKIGARCMVVGQSGQYNFYRAHRRGDPYVAQYAETKFCADLMSLVHLLNRRYSPYYKWLLRSTAQLPLLGEVIAGKVSALARLHGFEEKLALMDEICGLIVAKLQIEGLSDSTSRFLVDHGPAVHARIADPVLREMNVWLG